MCALKMLSPNANNYLLFARKMLCACDRRKDGKNPREKQRGMIGVEIDINNHPMTTIIIAAVE